MPTIEPEKGEIQKQLTFPADIFTRKDLRERRRDLHQKGIRSHLTFHAETKDVVAHYDLILVGLTHEMTYAPLMFSYFDDTSFLNPLSKHRPHRM